MILPLYVLPSALWDFTQVHKFENLGKVPFEYELHQKQQEKVSVLMKNLPKGDSPLFTMEKMMVKSLNTETFNYNTITTYPKYLTNW